MADKPYPWFRAYPEAAYDPKFRVVSAQSGLPYLMVFGAWWNILCIAGSSPVRGSLYVTAMKRYSNGDVAMMLQVSNDECNAILKTFIDLDMLEVDEHGGYRVKNWEKRQFVSDNSSERVKRHRKKAKRQDGNANETLHGRYSNDDVTPPDTESDTDTEAEEEGETAPSSSSPSPIPDWIPETPIEAKDHPGIQVYERVAGRVPGSRDYKTVVETVRFLARNRSPDELVDYLAPFWLAWSSRKTRDGRPYAAGNIAWLTEWAVNDEIPRDDGRQPNPTGQSLEDLGIPYIGS
jgi:hypothetical protein